MIRRILLLGLVFVSLSATARAQAPDAALAAEGEGRWDDAIGWHRAALAIDPRRADLWVRIADIEATRGRLDECIAALHQAATVTPADASIYFRLSQAYSMANQPAAAFEVIAGALALNPNSTEYLRARATLATWIAAYGAARDAYRRLVALEPQNIDVALAYARVSAWSGDTDQAVTQYERYLKVHPEIADTWIELAKAESWRGNYAAAMQALKTYRGRFGETESYSRTLAAVMTGSGRPGRAEDIVTPLLASTPDNLELHLTRTIALAMQDRSREAFASLDTVRRIAPESRETRDAERMVRTLLASTAEPQFSVYSDSDRLQIERFTPRVNVALVTGTQLSAGYDRATLSARPGSGLDAVDGATATEIEQSGVGVAQKLGPLTLDAQAGYAKSIAHDLVTYRAGAAGRLGDSVRFAVHRSSGPVVISPRTVSMGLTEIGHRVQFDWAPTLQTTIAFEGSYDEFSDGNRRVEWTVSPRRSVARTAAFNLDLGASAYRLETKYDLANGYYDPRRYEHYAFTAYPYFKVSGNIGLSFSTALGVQRDSLAPSFGFGGTVSGEATFGIYEPWVFKINGSASMNRRLESGAFQGFSSGVVLVRRF